MLFVFGAWLLVALFLLNRAIDQANAGRDTLDGLRADVTPESLLDGTAGATIERARDQLVEADRAADSWILDPLGALPLFDRQLESTRKLADAGVVATTAGLDTLRRTEALLDGPLPAGPARVAVLQEIAGLARESQALLARVDLGPVDGLFPELAEARDDAAFGILEVAQALDRAATGAEALATVFDGPTRYVFLAANNAEMRAGSGMFLQLGTMEIADGRISVSRLEEAQDLRLPPGTVEPPGSYGSVWSFLEPSREFRNLGATPRFDETGPLAVAMFEAATGQDVAGAIAVDPYVLEAFLGATGPLRVGDETISADTIVRELLHDQYVGIDIEGSRAANVARRERLADINAAVFDAIGSSSIDPTDLLAGIRDAVARRHLLVWAEDPAVQLGWEALGVAGSYRPESLGIAILNRGANKLDFYLNTTAVFSVDRDAEDDGFVPATLEITLANTTANGQSGYIAGPFPAVEAAREYGDYVGILAVTLPGYARSATIDGVENLTVAGPDPPTLVVGTQFVLPKDEQATFTVRFELPAALDAVRIEPSGRVRAQRWFTPEREYWDDRAHTVAIAPDGT